MQLTSSAFEDASRIPATFTCDGSQVSPPLAWTEVPDGTKCFVLLMEDPDVPRNLQPNGLFVHWMVWNIPAVTRSIASGVEPTGVVGLNTSGRMGYIGPCPPDRMHRYYFRLYALDTELVLPSTVTKGDLLRAMEGHVLDQANLMGRYERTRQ